jgi:hypothetical protein
MKNSEKLHVIGGKMKITQSDVKRIWEAVRSIMKKRGHNTTNISLEGWIKHLFATQELDLSVGEVQISGLFMSKN